MTCKRRGASATPGLRRGVAAMFFAFAVSLLAPPVHALPSEPSFAAPTAAFNLGGADHIALAPLTSNRIPFFPDVGVLHAFIGTDAGLAFSFNEGSATAPVFVPTGMASRPGDVLAPVLGDLDRDGTTELLVGTGGGEIVQLNLLDGAFQPNPYGLTSVGGVAVPALADLDADGDLDVLVGTVEGHLVLYRNDGTAVAPAFASPQPNPLGLANVGSFASPSLGDLDGDGDVDALVGGEDGQILFMRNTGTAVAPAFAAPVTNPFGLTAAPSNSAPALADIDADGDLDAFIASGGERDVLFFRNDAVAMPRVLAAATPALVSVPDVGSDAIPALADIDGDGDLDLFAGNLLGDLAFFRNTGDASAPVLESAGNNPFGFSRVGTFAVPAFGDVDGDGDLDLFVGRRNGDTVLLTNHGTATAPDFRVTEQFPLLINPYGLLNVGDFAAPAVADWDHDGDLDVLLGNHTVDDSGEERVEFGAAVVYQNVGDSLAPQFVASDAVASGTLAPRAVPAWGDVDGDGDVDALIGSGDGDTRLFRNVGTAGAPAFAAPVVNPLGFANVGERAAPCLADLDRDGDLDALIGNRDGQVVVLAGGPIPPPATETPTPTRTATRANTRTATATPTDAPEEPFTPTVTVSATRTGTPPTPTPTGGPDVCAGDCNDSGDVTVGEAISAVNIALGNTPVSTCAAADLNGDGMIPVNELIAIVGRIQSGCPA